ncbi:Bug family tripartite tricarboxylate transporter substrate binding protein [Pollutimonas nitritireducens]|nr:tripartite tricarboxylate transporter substrate binding protein [Pollutimonas nitritireducens]
MRLLQNVLETTLGRPLAMAAVAATLAAASAVAGAQPSYPDKPLRLVMGFAAGGSVDPMARTITRMLGERLGQTIVLEHKPGAGGTIAVGSVVNAPPDGYTLLLSNPGPLIVKPQGDPLSKLSAIGRVADMPLALVVPAGSPFKNLQEMVVFAKANPGKLTYGSGGYGATTHIGMEMLKHEAGLDIVHVPYKGQAAATPDLISGRIDMLLDGWNSSIPNVQSGKLRYLGVATLNRSAIKPDVPTIAEQGFPGFNAALWWGIWAPAGTPSDVVEKLGRELQVVTQTDELKNVYKQLGVDPQSSTPEQLTAFVHSEQVRVQNLVKDANIRLD